MTVPSCDLQQIDGFNGDDLKALVEVEVKMANQLESEKVSL